MKSEQPQAVATTATNDGLWRTPSTAKERWKLQPGNHYTTEELARLEQELSVTAPRRRRAMPFHG